MKPDTFKKGYSTLVIAGGPLGMDMDVRLNGEEVPGLQSLDLSIYPDSITELTMRVQVSEVEIDADTMVALQALVDRDKE